MADAYDEELWGSAAEAVIAVEGLKGDGCGARIWVFAVPHRSQRQYSSLLSL